MFKKMHDTGLFGNHILPNPSFMANPLTVNNGIHSLHFRFCRRGSNKGKRCVSFLNLSTDIHLYRKFVIKSKNDFCQLKISALRHPISVRPK